MLAAPGNEKAKVKDRYVLGIYHVIQGLRAQMKLSARLVVGGIYPNANYGQEELDLGLDVVKRLRTWKEVDYIIDFLSCPCHDGTGKWSAGSMADAGHPNDQGHHHM